MTVLVDTGVLFADHDTDATTAALCERHDLDYVPSFDDDFDGVAPRLDPSNA